MPSIQSAPYLKDMEEAIRESIKDGRGQAAAGKENEEEARPQIKQEREDTPGLFVTQDDETEIPADTARTTVSSGPYAGLKSARKRVHDETADSKEKKVPVFGPAKKVAKKGDGLKNVHVVNSRPMDDGPDWYQGLDPKAQYTRSDVQDLKYFLTLVANVKKSATDPTKDMKEALNHLRQRLQEMEFFITLQAVVVKKSGLLNQDGLPMIIANSIQGVDFPVDIRSDADLLFRKWMRGQIDPHLYRGIITKKGTGKENRIFKSHSIDPAFSGKVSCDYAGPGNLVVGQWWPLQLCAKRDGAHGELEAGIHGQKGQGAYSVVMSGGGYANIDNGTIIEYCGTQGSDNSPSAGTKLMLKAEEIQQSVRVLRSSSLPASNPYRPARGLRYDGQYRIISHEILDNATAMYRFLLSRVGLQDPIRYTGEGKIPSDAQMTELAKVRDEYK